MLTCASENADISQVDDVAGKPRSSSPENAARELTKLIEKISKNALQNYLRAFEHKL